MIPGQFVLQISQDLIIDLSMIDKHSWLKLRATVKRLMQDGQIKDPGMAYIAAFLIYVQDLEMLMPEYDPKRDKMM